jgi:IPT/TIG domain
MLDFPNAPTVGMGFAAADNKWSWDGTKWVFTDAAVGPPPLDQLTVTGLTPNTARIGEPRIKVTVQGTRFSSASRVNWFGSDIPTQFVSATALEISINPYNYLVTGDAPVFVTDGADVSNTVNFTLTASLAVLTAINPNTAVAGQGAVVSTATGTDFNSLSYLIIEGNAVYTDTQFVSPTELTFTISPQSETPRTAQVTLQHGAGSVPLTFT